MSAIGNRWALIGPGAIGLYYGGFLAQRGVELHVLARSDADVMKADGIRVRMVDPVTEVLDDDFFVQPKQVARRATEIGSVDVVVVSAKSTVNDVLIETLRPLIRDGSTVILSLQNGMGNVEHFAQAFPNNPVLGGLCFVCVNRTEPAVVENYLPGRVEIGSLEGRWPCEAEAVVDAFKAAGLKCRVSKSLSESLWRKLCWNVPFNGLAIAAGGITTDKILADPDLAQRARVLMGEVKAAAQTEGIEIEDHFAGPIRCD